MAMQISGIAGPQIRADGTEFIFRGSKDGSQVVQDGHAKYQEAVYRGNVYTAANQTGLATAAGLSATTPVLTLANPAGSGKLAVLLYAGITFSVAPAAAAVCWLAANVNPVAAAVTGTAFTARNALLGAPASNSVLPLLAATLPATPTAICQLGVMFAAALTVNNTNAPMGRWFDGSIILAQGAAISIQTSTASGALGTWQEFIWEEIPV